MKTRIVICLLAAAFTVACVGSRQENGDIHRLMDVEKRLLGMERQGMRVIRTQEEWDALKAENDSVRRADHSAGSYRWAASLLWHERKYEEALAYTDTALALAGGHPETVASIRFVRANCFRDCGKPTEEQEELMKIIAGGPDDYVHDARERLAECLFEQGLTEEALSVLPDSLSIEGEALINFIQGHDSLQQAERNDDATF